MSHDRTANDLFFIPTMFGNGTGTDAAARGSLFAF